MKSSAASFQLVSHSVHERSATEWAARTLENHFVPIQREYHPDFPLSLWCSLLLQKITLSADRLLRHIPKSSVRAAAEGNFSCSQAHTSLLESEMNVCNPPS